MALLKVLGTSTRGLVETRLAVLLSWQGVGFSETSDCMRAQLIGLLGTGGKLYSCIQQIGCLMVLVASNGLSTLH